MAIGSIEMNGTWYICDVPIKDAVTIGKDLVVSLAAIVTASVAVNGINSWRRETQGKARFDVARTLLKSAFRVRDEVSYCRSPFIPAAEFPQEHDPTSHSNEDRYKAYVHVYSNRWNPVRDAIKEFDAAVLEAEVLWGEPVRKAAEKLRTCVRSLFTAIEFVLSDTRSGKQELDNEMRRDFRRVVHSSGKDDTFGKEVADAVTELEGLLVEHLKQR